MDIGIDTYKKTGIPPPALLNFAALLGWNPNALQNKGVMTLDEMVAEVCWRLHAQVLLAAVPNKTNSLG